MSVIHDCHSRFHTEMYDRLLVQCHPCPIGPTKSTLPSANAVAAASSVSMTHIDAIRSRFQAACPFSP
jgi:hypothetical protein